MVLPTSTQVPLTKWDGGGGKVRCGRDEHTCIVVDDLVLDQGERVIEGRLEVVIGRRGNLLQQRHVDLLQI